MKGAVPFFGETNGWRLKRDGRPMNRFILTISCFELVASTNHGFSTTKFHSAHTLRCGWNRWRLETEQFSVVSKHVSLPTIVNGESRRDRVSHELSLTSSSSKKSSFLNEYRIFKKKIRSLLSVSSLSDFCDEILRLNFCSDILNLEASTHALHLEEYALNSACTHRSSQSRLITECPIEVAPIFLEYIKQTRNRAADATECVRWDVAQYEQGRMRYF